LTAITTAPTNYTSHGGQKTHTTISNPPSCYIRVADTICTWEEGKVLVFDDSYEHEAVLAPSSLTPEQPEQLEHYQHKH
jgi:Aspartyl/Asparaginyl beta-hydroxylase